MLYFQLLIFVTTIVCAHSISVGIVGAGISGLYAALLLQSLEVDDLQYEILEARERPGGRIWTYHFSEENWDYFVRPTNGQRILC